MQEQCDVLVVLQLKSKHPKCSLYYALPMAHSKRSVMSLTHRVEWPNMTRALRARVPLRSRMHLPLDVCHKKWPSLINYNRKHWLIKLIKFYDVQLINYVTVEIDLNTR